MTIEHLTTPPGKTDLAYVLPCFTGELWTIPTSNSTMRLLVTGKETDNAFAVVGTGGTYDKPIGFHYHREAHDVFLCLKGKINVWANDQARSLGPGDFASVPPGTIHQYQIDSAHTEFIGLIIPGGWEEFFRFIGEPYAGPLFPTNDRRDPFEVLIPKLMAATEKFDMIPVREKAQFDPQPWDGTETRLPGKCETGGYFLRVGAGEKFVVGGTVVRALARREETGGRFSIYEVGASEIHRGKGVGRKLEFRDTHHAIYTVEGVLRLSIDGSEVSTTAGETTFVPAGTKWSFEAGSGYARAYVFANGGGIGEVLTSVGSKYEFPGVPAEAESWDESKLKGLETELKYVVI
ncbi:RmlC-like cupin [Mollisia scopiformis]|uniref:RmlC-like cupin n=1 Tax=Mollisia scopiformis TaxID=149040 RepID=A0A194X5L9_MOLSC|nr:RmlC-like cupin [Mollisia scopiformis]KUJ15465.1 RmlC-like cupin [Mollisia scopiformis]